MKRIIEIASILFLCFGCTDKNEELLVVNRAWELTSLTVGLSGEVLDDFPFRQTLFFEEDGLFLKQKVDNDTTLVAEGSYVIGDLNGQRIVTLKYDFDNPLIENCNNDTEETLQLYSDDLLIGGSFACDGPTLMYTPVLTE